MVNDDSHHEPLGKYLHFVASNPESTSSAFASCNPRTGLEQKLNDQLKY